MYNDAGGDINAMRRAQYAQNKDKINAQKRAAYAQRKLLKGNADGILNEGSEGYVPITRESIEAVRPFSCLGPRFFSPDKYCPGALLI